MGRPPKTQAQAQPAPPQVKSAPLEVFTITPATDGTNRSFWTKLGSAFINRDGSINVVLVGFPVNGQLQIREPRQYSAAPPPPPMHNLTSTDADDANDDDLPF